MADTMSHAQPLDTLMSAMTIGGQPVSSKTASSASSSSASTSAAPAGAAGGQGRLKPMIMNRYCSPAFQRPANTGLQARAAEQEARSQTGAAAGGAAAVSGTSTSYQESARGPLLKLAGINVPVSSTSGTASPGKPKQYVAHGVHGPVHGTSSRLGAVSTTADALAKGHGGHTRLHTASSSQSTSATAQAGASGSGTSSKSGLGAYDGGFEADVKDREVPQGEGAKMLEMESHKAGYVPHDLSVTHVELWEGSSSRPDTLSDANVHQLTWQNQCTPIAHRLYHRPTTR
jgi:hypothetical protein